ncbi:MAG TPA: SRPBCC family protein [Chitinophagales bacterium]|nr:SRPBCC family protein [Chitinophagales bacterium]
MYYVSEIIIDRPVDEVVRLFDNPNNLYEWMNGLQSFELISGTAGQPGAKSKLVYQMGKRRIEMIETITERNLPSVFSGTYDADGVHNKVVNRFESLAPNQTKYITENTFEFKGFMKLMGWLMPGAFKKQSYVYMQQFKAFVEKQPTI